MIKKKLMKSNQEQAVASWINYLNQTRLDELLGTLSSQNMNLDKAQGTIDESFSVISKNIIERNRGGSKGMHGFIAEVAECGIGNARREIQGKLPNYIWINDNGPADLMRDGIFIQQKFANAGNHLSLQAMKQHLSSYPKFLRQGGKYQIPKDHYNQIMYLLSVTKEKANKMPTQTGEFSLKQWQEIQDFFRNGDIRITDIEPSKLTYQSVQAENIESTLKIEKNSLKETDQKIRDDAYRKSKPTLQEGMKATVVSAAIEGGTSFCFSIIKKRKSGKRIKNFTKEDWSEIFLESGVSFAKGEIRGISIYTLTNYTATSASVASSLVTASFGIAEQAFLYRNKRITEEQFIINSEILCLDASVSALSSFIGQALIPVPVLGAVIGNTVGTLLYQIAKDNLSKKEQKLINEYLKSLVELDIQLDMKYRECIRKLNIDLKRYYELLERAFSPDCRSAFTGSIMLAQHIGVPSEEILKSTEEIDAYFTERTR
ncbi:MAG TPA: hypothetical protein DDZ89_17755 [Clostridiales bacterium]|nr:hypothetical protein [Clostridiales bacterium]